MRPSRAILASVLLLAACETTPGLDQPLGPDEALLLAQVGNRGFPVQGIIFRCMETQESVSLAADLARPTVHLVRVPAGRYFLRALKPVYANVIVEPMNEPRTPDEVFEVAPGRINYAGDWWAMESRRVSGPVWSIGVEYTSQTVRDAQAKHPEVFERYELVVSPRGAEPVPFAREEQRPPGDVP